MWYAASQKKYETSIYYNIYYNIYLLQKLSSKLARGNISQHNKDHLWQMYNWHLTEEIWLLGVENAES